MALLQNLAVRIWRFLGAIGQFIGGCGIAIGFFIVGSLIAVAFFGSFIVPTAGLGLLMMRIPLWVYLTVFALIFLGICWDMSKQP